MRGRVQSFEGSGNLEYASIFLSRTILLTKASVKEAFVNKASCLSNNFFESIFFHQYKTTKEQGAVYKVCC
jgi:hypothetical protein